MCSPRRRVRNLNNNLLCITFQAHSQDKEQSFRMYCLRGVKRETDQKPRSTILASLSFIFIVAFIKVCINRLNSQESWTLVCLNNQRASRELVQSPRQMHRHRIPTGILDGPWHLCCRKREGGQPQFEVTAYAASRARLEPNSRMARSSDRSQRQEDQDPQPALLQP